MGSQWLNLKSESLLEHFGLTRGPFNITPDPSFLYLSASHQQALSRLLYGIDARKGFIVLAGEVGTGKTMLIHCLLQELKKRNTQSTLIFNTINHSKDLLRDVCEDLGFTAFREDRQNIHTYLKLLNQLLLESYHQGKNVTLILDEAQTLSTKVLENIRLLSNFETTEDKLLQIVLAGQPELAERLNLPELRPLKQRVVLYHHLRPLNFGECTEYITRRVEIAGGTRPIFTPEALQAIYAYSGGIPRVINVLCENGLLSAYVTGAARVRAAVIREIAAERSLAMQSEEEVPKVVVSRGSDRYAGPERRRHLQPPHGITRLGRIVDDEVETEESADAARAAADFTTLSAGTTTDEPVAAAETEITKEKDLGPVAPELAAEDRIAEPSVESSSSDSTEEIADALAVLTKRIEMERQRRGGVFESALSADLTEAEAELSRASQAAADEPRVSAAEEIAAAPPPSTSVAAEVVSGRFLAFMIASLTEAMGPMAPLVIRDQVAALGEQLEAFPKARLAELVESASQEILEQSLKTRFQRVIHDEAQTLSSGKEEE